MIGFWIVAGLTAAAASGLIVVAAGRARVGAAGPAAETALYARHLAELDELHGRGLLADDEHRASRAEVGRRLLSASESPEAPEVASPAGRKVLFAVVVAAPLAAGGLYLATGSPGAPDQPYAARLDGWRRADPARLPTGVLAALAEDAVDRRPDDPNGWRALGQARTATGESFQAVRALEQAARLGNTADDWTLLGEVLSVRAGGAPGPEAAAAFREALKRDPASVPARYGLAQAAAAAGDVPAARAQLLALARSLPLGDARRTALETEVAALAGGQ